MTPLGRRVFGHRSSSGAPTCADIGRFQPNRPTHVAALVGHTPIRTHVMGDAATEREATEPEVEHTLALVAQALRDGAIGAGHRVFQAFQIRESSLTTNPSGCPGSSRGLPLVRSQGQVAIAPSIAPRNPARTYYALQLVEKRRREVTTAEDVINLFRHVEVGGRKLGDDEIASHLSMLIIGGSETFPKTFANGIRRLAEHPEQRAFLRANPAAIPEAFREILRYDMPTQFLCRTVAQPTEIGGHKLTPGQGVLFLYASANRDENEFPDAATFEVRRKPDAGLGSGLAAERAATHRVRAGLREAHGELRTELSADFSTSMTVAGVG